MKNGLISLIFSFFALFNILNAKELNLNYITKKEQSIIEISVLTTIGDKDKLAIYLNSGLDNGLTINEINEVLIQIYAYAGFPRSLGGIFTFMKVVEDRKVKGIIDEVGKESSVFPKEYLEDKDLYGAKIRAMLAGQKTIPEPSGYRVFSPTIDKFLKEHLFADIFVRDILTHKQRELSTISVLSALGNVNGPLKFHLKASINTGWTKEELKEFVKVLENCLDKEKVSDVNKLLESI